VEELIRRLSVDVYIILLKYTSIHLNILR